jgi:hypothetical protein
MKSRVSRLVDLRKGLDYDFERDTAAASDDPMDIVASNCSFSVSAIEMELCAVRALRPDVKRPFLHISLSCPPGERLSRRTWARVIRFVLDDVGLETRRHQYAARRHARKKLDHCHVIVNRIALDAHVWSGEFEAWKFIMACQRAEIAFGLELTVGLHNKDSNVPHKDRLRTADSDSVVRSNRQSQRELGRVQDSQAMTEKLQDCAARAQSFQEFQEMALIVGLEVVEVVNVAWRFSGVVVRETWAQKSFKLSSITSGRLNYQKLEEAFERNRRSSERARLGEAAELQINVGAQEGNSSVTSEELLHQGGQFGAEAVKRSAAWQDRKRMAMMMMECADRARDFDEFRALALRRGIVVISIFVEGAGSRRILIRESWAREFHRLSSITRGRLDSRTLAIELEENDRLSEIARPLSEGVSDVDDDQEEDEFDPQHQDHVDDSDVNRPGDT